VRERQLATAEYADACAYADTDPNAHTNPRRLHDRSAGLRLGVCERQLVTTQYADTSATLDASAGTDTDTDFHWVHHGPAGERLGMRQRQLAAARACAGDSDAADTCANADADARLHGGDSGARTGVGVRRRRMGAAEPSTGRRLVPTCEVFSFQLSAFSSQADS
jgi:hypothetical protein